MLSRRLLLAPPPIAFASPAAAQEKSIVVASTTSTQDSGLFGYLLPIFKQKTGIDVKVVAQGTGQALDTARRGDADVVFVHAKSAEEKFLSEGFGVKRFPVMYNDFVLIGPKAAIRPASRAARISLLRSRRSRTRRRRSSRAATEAARTSPRSRSGRWPASTSRRTKGDWYKSIGQGMGAALNTASASNAYVLTDRGTWLAFKNRGELAIAVEGDKRLFNQYGVMLVNPEKHLVGEEAAGAAVHRLAGFPGGPERRSPAIRSTASSCFIRMPASPDA